MSKQNKTTTAQAVETKAPAEVEKQTPAAEKAEVDNPTPVAEDATEKTAPAKTAKQPQKAKMPDFMKGYIKAYPKERVFHVTTDKQVFLGKDYSLAKAHQKSLGKGEITTYNL